MIMIMKIETPHNPRVTRLRLAIQLSQAVQYYPMECQIKQSAIALLETGTK